MLEKHIEAILFVKGEAISVYELARLLEVDVQQVEESIDRLVERLSERGLRIIRNDYFVEMRTAPECCDVVDKLLKEDTDKDLSRAAIETLSVVLYQSPISATEIDFVRGVNSRNTLRSLSARGLIVREYDRTQNRYVYKPGMELLAHLGLASLEEMPDYSQNKEKIKKFLLECSE